jgi:hypothetical protein
MNEDKKQPPCSCGNRDFIVRYTEICHERIDAYGDCLEDGINMVQHERDQNLVWCSACGKKVEWIGEAL